MSENHNVKTTVEAMHDAESEERNPIGAAAKAAKAKRATKSSKRRSEDADLAVNLPKKNAQKILKRNFCSLLQASNVSIVLGGLFEAQSDGTYRSMNSNILVDVTPKVVKAYRNHQTVVINEEFDMADTAQRAQAASFCVGASASLMKFGSATAHTSFNSVSSSGAQRREALAIRGRTMDLFELLHESELFLHVNEVLRTALERLPDHYDGESKAAFTAFFKCYGTHYVSQVTTGAVVIFKYFSEYAGNASGSGFGVGAKSRLMHILNSKSISQSAGFISSSAEGESNCDAAEYVTFACYGGKKGLHHYEKAELEQWMDDVKNIRAAPTVVTQSFSPLFMLLKGTQRIAMQSATEEYLTHTRGGILRRGIAAGLAWRHSGTVMQSVFEAHVMFDPPLPYKPNWVQATLGSTKDHVVSLRVDASSLSCDGIKVIAQRYFSARVAGKQALGKDDEKADYVVYYSVGFYGS